MDNHQFLSILGPLKEKPEHSGRSIICCQILSLYDQNDTGDTVWRHSRHTTLVHSSPGIFGKVFAYFGVVESQGRATLHLHLLLWLANAPSMDITENLLTQGTFREHIRNSIRANIQAHIPGMESLEYQNNPECHGGRVLASSVVRHRRLCDAGLCIRTVGRKAFQNCRSAAMEPSHFDVNDVVRNQ